MLAALLLAAGCASPPAIAVQGDHHPLVSRVEALVDRERALSFEDVTRAPGCNAFRPVSGQPNFGAIAGAAWLRFAPRWTGPMGDWRLVVRFAGLERVCAHWPLAAGGTAVECLVRGEPTQRARWQNGLLTFAAPADLAREAPVHVQVESELWLKAPLELVTVEALVQRETRREHAWGVYYGLLAMLVVVSLGFYLGRRDRAFLYFAFKIGALTLALALWQGRFAAWDPQAFSLTRLTPVFAAVFLAFGSRFYQQFLLTRRYARPAHRILEACFWAALATALMVAPYPVSAVQLLSATTLVWLLTVLWAAAMRVRERYWPALWVLGAVSVLWLSVLAVSLSIIGMPLVSTGLGLQLTYVGNMVAAAFLVFGLVERVRLLGAERDRATELASANRNLALYRAHFDELTGLPNRSKLREDLQECIAQAGAGARMAVVTLGPDRFRSLNHALGHEGGDAVLVEIAGRLRHEIRTDELLARVAPARFVALLRLQPAADLAELDERCAQMRRALHAIPPCVGHAAADRSRQHAVHEHRRRAVPGARARGRRAAARQRRGLLPRARARRRDAARVRPAVPPARRALPGAAQGPAPGAGARRAGAALPAAVLDAARRGGGGRGAAALAAQR
jgi:GGDEF domain-containing protein